jgi:hypothetical protein
MRTTLTLDDDVAAALERLRKTCNASLKDLVNEALRRGLKEMMSAMPSWLASSLPCPGYRRISSLMPTWPHWRSSTD